MKLCYFFTIITIYKLAQRSHPIDLELSLLTTKPTTEVHIAALNYFFVSEVISDVTSRKAGFEPTTEIFRIESADHCAALLPLMKFCSIKLLLASKPSLWFRL